ncbi:MAG TPA: NAD(P)/FAD-dependent oxidoreductase [bacterium]|nr:NAD(P)/FAD-dependent oxidoreductase [bacterium]
MPRPDFDVIVAGAGPAGGMAARTAAALGLRTALVEEHEQPGLPAHCSGKLQLHAFREFDLPASLVMNTLRAGAFYSPGGAVFRVRREEADSHVVDRVAFDRWLAEAAARCGAALLLDTRLGGAERLNGAIRVSGTRRGRPFSATASVLIDAEGARPVLPRTLGLRIPRAYVYGLQYQMAGVDLDEPDMPEIYLGSARAPGFFGWIMPIGPDRARAGVCVDPRLTPQSPIHYLERLMREHPVASRRLRHAVIERKLAGPIPVLGARRPTVAPGLLVAGDAAGQVKATSGGGIYFSLISGRLAAEAAHEYVGGARDALPRYEDAWRRRFGRELYVTAFARMAINHMSDAEMDTFVAAMAEDSDLRRTIEQRGDTAFQSRLLAPVLLRALRWSLVRPVGSALLRALRYGVLALWDGGASAARSNAAP